MKKLTLSLVAAGLTTASLGAFAALPTGAAPFQVVVPNLKCGVEFTLEGTYLQPTSPNLNYLTLSTAVPTTATGTTITNTNTAFVKPKYDLGYAVGIGYVFPDSGNDVQLKWSHFDHTTSGSTTAPTLTTSNATVVGSVNSNVKFQHDAVDLDVGQYMSIGTRLQSRLFGGLRYVSLKNDITNTGVDTITTTTSSNSTSTEVATGATTQNSKFTGIGPRLGFETNYNVGGGFGVSGMLAGSLLVGQVEASGTAVATDVVTSSGANVYAATATNNLTMDKQDRLVPALDAKLGLNYTFDFAGSSNATVELGYKATEYFGAIDRVGGSASVRPSASDTAVGATATAVGSTSNNIGFNGPFLSLNVKL